MWWHLFPNVRTIKNDRDRILDEHGDEIFQDATVLRTRSILTRKSEEDPSLCREIRQKSIRLLHEYDHCNERRDFLRRTACFVCKPAEEVHPFSEDYGDLKPEEMARCLAKRIQSAHIPKMVITMGSDGAAYADQEGKWGVYSYEGRCG